jgi:hypothetical protein
MRYAVYISSEDGSYEFSSSFADLELAKTQEKMINSWGGKVKAVIIKVHQRDQVIDPGAKDFWPKVTPREAAKIAREQLLAKAKG